MPQHSGLALLYTSRFFKMTRDRIGKPTKSTKLNQRACFVGYEGYFRGTGS